MRVGIHTATFFVAVDSGKEIVGVTNLRPEYAPDSVRVQAMNDIHKGTIIPLYLSVLLVPVKSLVCTVLCFVASISHANRCC
jgi:hypothetical protein